MLFKRKWKIFLVLGMVTGVAVAGAFAQTADHVLSNEELSQQVRELQKQLRNMQQVIQKQNEIIEKLSHQPVEAQPSIQQIAEVKEQLKQEIKADIKKDEPSFLRVGKGNVDLSLLVQEWYVVDDHAHDNFRHRRLELGVGGNLIDHLKWKLVTDPSLVQEDNTTRSILKDAYVGYDGIPHHTIQMGQYKIPVTEEGFRSSAKIDTAERSFIGRTYGDKRDIGVMASGNWKYADYQLGVFNGEGPNKSDTNDHKDIAGRFVLKLFPDNNFWKGLQVGSSFYERPSHVTSPVKKRIGAEARFEYDKFSLKSEFMKAQDGAIPSNGWYTQLGYFIAPKWQLIAKYEGFDPNEQASGDQEFDTTIGLNYFLINPTTKLQLNYVHKTVRGGADDNQIITAAQYAF
ncbi:MAG: hypothetical protein HY209_03825 [Candidatus Omnitrophica bacterium]|nr:hypothetical protein [Candidatus Omnitrophota bacterium]